MRIDVTNLYEEAKRILNMSPDVSVHEDDVVHLKDFISKQELAEKIESDSKPKKTSTGLNQMMENKKELLKYYKKKSFWNPGYNMNILKESQTKELYNYLILQRDRISSDVKCNYYNSLISEQAIQFNNINC